MSSNRRSIPPRISEVRRPVTSHRALETGGSSVAPLYDDRVVERRISVRLGRRGLWVLRMEERRRVAIIFRRWVHVGDARSWFRGRLEVAGATFLRTGRTPTDAELWH